MVTTRRPRIFPGSRSDPHMQDPAPADPPAMKPPIVAVRLVEGWKRSSPPTSRRVCSSIAISFAPACARSTPGFAQMIRSIADRSSTIPPLSGIAWP